MGIVVRQSIQTSVISYAGVAIGYLNLLFLYPKFLAIEQIGLLRTITDAAFLLAPFAQTGLGQSILRFFPRFSNTEDKGHGFINLMLLFSLVGFGVFVLAFLLLENQILALFGTQAELLSNYVGLVLWLTLLLVVTTLLEFYSRSLLKISFPVFLREIGIRLLQAILVTLYFTDVLTFHQFLVASVLIYVISLSSLAIYLIVGGNLTLTLSTRSVSTPKLKEVLTYSLLSLLSAGSVVIIGKLDSLMITAMIGLSSNAIYTTAYYMATVIEIPKRAITHSAATLISNAFAQNKLDDIREIYRKASINQFIIGGLLFVGIWANLQNIFDIMPKGDQFEAGTWVVIWVGMAKLIDMSFGPNGEIILLSRFYWFNIFTLVVLAVLVVVTNLIFIPMFGLTGAAVATTISLVTFNVAKWLFIALAIKLQPFGLSHLKVVAIILVVGYAQQWLPVVPIPIIDMISRSVLITLIYGAGILMTRSSAEATKLFYDILARIGLKR